MGDSRLRILAIMEADRVTGPAKNLLRFADKARNYIDLSVATYLRGVSDNGFLQAARDLGLSAHGIPETGRFDREVIGGVRRLVSREMPDILQTHNTKSHILMRLAGNWRDIPWIAFHHGYTAEDWKMRLYNQCDRWSLRTPRRVVTMCEPFVDQMRARGVPRERIDVIPNAIEPARPLRAGELDEWKTRCKMTSKVPLLAAIGRLSHEKGHHILLDSLARLRDRPWRLLVAGDGIARVKLQEQARANGIDDRIEWLGLLPDVRPVYALADVFVLPSLSEGSPNVLLEAMAAGVPAVAAAVGGVPETVTDEESALVVPPGNAEALARAIARLLDDPELAARLAAAGTARAAAFSPEAYMKRLGAVYTRVLGRDSGIG